MGKTKAVVLLSGGLDSATTLYLAKKKGYECLCLIFDYGQRHKREIESARRVAKAANCKWRLLKIPLPWKGSSLLDKRKKLPVGCERPTTNDQRLTTSTIPSTYVPARNTILLSFALSYAEAAGAKKVFIGANAVDYSGYPDCRPEFINAFGRVAGLGTKAGICGDGVKIEAPLISKSKAQIINLGKRLSVPYELTWSCYRGKKYPCGACDSCRLRSKGFSEAGMDDPLLKR